MQDTKTHTQSITFLAKLRFSVLVAGEMQPELWWSSNGLSQEGQSDLSIIFPRTSINAAMEHASELARLHHDERTRAVGVYHLFRLPTEIQSALHRTSIQLEQDGFFGADPRVQMWSDFPGISTSPTKAQEGPIDLGVFHPHNQSDLERLATTYKAAFDEGKSCVPYFKINP